MNRYLFVHTSIMIISFLSNCNAEECKYDIPMNEDFNLDRRECLCNSEGDKFCLNKSGYLELNDVQFQQKGPGDYLTLQGDGNLVLYTDELNIFDFNAVWDIQDGKKFKHPNSAIGFHNQMLMLYEMDSDGDPESLDGDGYPEYYWAAAEVDGSWLGCDNQVLNCNQCSSYHCDKSDCKYEWAMEKNQKLHRGECLCNSEYDKFCLNKSGYLELDGPNFDQKSPAKFEQKGPGDSLRLQDDGNLVVYTDENDVVWDIFAGRWWFSDRYSEPRLVLDDQELYLHSGYSNDYYWDVVVDDSSLVCYNHVLDCDECGSYHC